MYRMLVVTGAILLGTLLLAGTLPSPSYAATDEATVEDPGALGDLLRERIQAMEEARLHVREQDRVMLRQMLDEARQDLDRLQERDRERLRETYALMEQRAERHRERLQEMLGPAPDAARRALQRAIATCEQTRTMARQRLRIMEQRSEHREMPRDDVRRPSDMRPPGAGRPETMPGGRGMGGPSGGGMMGSPRH